MKLPSKDVAVKLFQHRIIPCSKDCDSIFNVIIVFEKKKIFYRQSMLIFGATGCYELSHLNLY